MENRGGFFFFFFWFVLNPDNTAAIIYLSKATTLAFEINQSNLRSLSLPRLPPSPLRGLQIYLRASRAPSPSLIFFFPFFFFCSSSKKAAEFPDTPEELTTRGGASKSCLSPVGGCEPATPPLFGTGGVMHNAGVAAAAGWAARKPVMWRPQFERYRRRLRAFVSAVAAAAASRSWSGSSAISPLFTRPQRQGVGESCTITE